MLESLSALVSIAVWVYFLRRYSRPGWRQALRFAVAGALGGLASAILPIFLNVRLYQTLGLGDDGALALREAVMVSATAGFGEEGSKALVCLLLFSNNRWFRRPADGLLLCASVALGFAGLENLEYAFTYGSLVNVARSLTSVPVHLGLGILWGTALTRARDAGLGGRLAHLLPALLMAGGLHTLFDFIVLSEALSGPLALGLAAAMILGLVEYANLRLRDVHAALAHAQPGVAARGCGAAAPPGSHACESCGADLRAVRYVHCPVCATRTLEPAASCPGCGQHLEPA